jgi:hypothetical protein
MKTFITVSRKWNNPKIVTTLSEEGISLVMDMGDFAKALKQEIGKVTWVFTQAEFEKRLDAAIANVLQGVKEESIKVV